MNRKQTQYKTSITIIHVSTYKYRKIIYLYLYVLTCIIMNIYEHLKDEICVIHDIVKFLASTYLGDMTKTNAERLQWNDLNGNIQ